MSATITALYGGVLALFFVFMGINVTIHRFRSGVMIGDGGEKMVLHVAGTALIVGRMLLLCPCGCTAGCTMGRARSGRVG